MTVIFLKHTNNLQFKCYIFITVIEVYQLSLPLITFIIVKMILSNQNFTFQNHSYKIIVKFMLSPRTMMILFDILRSK